MSRVAKFNIGAVVLHKRFGYRAIVIDIDPLFQASGRFNPQALKRDFALRNPWYRLLVDGSSQMTYVEECVLEADTSQAVVDNPNIVNYLVHKNGAYEPISTAH